MDYPMSTDLFDLTGRVVLITGSSRGLGNAIAGGLADAGAVVCLNARHHDRLADAVAGLRAAGRVAHGYAFDVTDPAAVAAGVGRIEADLGRIDVLVNNAGINLRSPLETIDADLWRKVMDTNLTAALLVAQAAVKGMIARRAGKIINICSLMSEVARPTVGAYAASKGGLKMLTRAMAVEWAQHNIQTNAIGPGYFATEMTRPLVEDEKFNAWITARTPARRWGDPAELVGPAVFLASRASNFVNGHILYVDGGVLAGL
jgi:gluconate 5-dehydrogenase